MLMDKRFARRISNNVAWFTLLVLCEDWGQIMIKIHDMYLILLNTCSLVLEVIAAKGVLLQSSTLMFLMAKRLR